MKHLRVALAVLFTLFGRNACGQATERESFEAKIYSIEAISHFGIDDGKFAALADAQKRSVIESRNDLMAMLQAIQHRLDVTRFASREMVRKYRTSTALAASIIDPETSILAAGVSDFALIDKETIRLKFFAVLSSEGNIIISEKAAVLKQTDSAWRVAEFE
ncbi:MAG: hypothetical protein WA766_13850, partial [Candidatus Acidiferrales bacterium]